MPQEVEVWYLLPSLRKELARIFTEKHKLNQKETAKILGITESAVSQYLKDKRARSLNFSKVEVKEIESCADAILKDRENAKKHFYKLSVKLRGSKSMCDLHRKHDSNLPFDCQMCREN